MPRLQLAIFSRWQIVILLVLCTCLSITYAKGGRAGGGSRGGGSRGGGGGRYGSRSSSTSHRPSPSNSKPSPSSSKPSPSYSRPSSSYSPTGSKPSYESAPRQPAYSFNNVRLDGSRPGPSSSYSPTASKPSYESAPRQPSYNPFNDVRLDGSRPGNQNPSYSGSPSLKPPTYPGLSSSYPSSSSNHQSINRPYPVQPGYPGGPSIQLGGNQQYPVQPGYPGGPSIQAGGNRPYPVQPGYPGSPSFQPGGNRPYPVQSGYSGVPSIHPEGNQPYPVQPGYPGGSYLQSRRNQPYPVQSGYPGSPSLQAGANRPYPVQPNYPSNFHQTKTNNPLSDQPFNYYVYPGGIRIYPQHTLGANVWKPHYGMPAPVYMNYGGIPTGVNMHKSPHKKKGFTGSLMSLGHTKPKSYKENKYYDGSFPSPYGVAYNGGRGAGHADFLGYGSSASMKTIFPYMEAKTVREIHKHKFNSMPYMHITQRHYHYHRQHRSHSWDSDNKWDEEGYFDVYNSNYVGKCEKPLKKEHSEIRCKSSSDEIQCDARCGYGYKFHHGIEIVSNKCWHVTGVWKPQKNFPDCKPVCYEECLNGGQCIRPGVCS